jgi:4-amino-4-deoxy-L-arabinose transferase-like glycosyltransferase
MTRHTAFNPAGSTETAVQVTRPRRLAAVLLPLSIFFVTGLMGLDFGTHWDERGFQIAPVKRIVASGLPLPGHYGYPSFNYWVSTAALLPEMFKAWVEHGVIRDRLLQYADTHSYLLRLRTIFLMGSALSVLWVYLLVLRWRDSVGEALLAASFLGLSWEVAYHARWIATDTMLMQFAALTLLLIMLSRLEPDKTRWLYLAAVTAGLGFGTKYPGGLLLIPVLVAGYFAWKQQREGLMKVLFLLFLVFMTTFLLSTPAVILRPSETMNGVLYEIRHYSTGHAGHTVTPGLEHAWRMLLYFSSVLFSWYAPIAFCFFSLSILGAFVLLKEDGQTALLLLSFPICYFVYFSLQHAMVVRNLLALTPFLAVLAARGVMVLWHMTRPRRLPSGAIRFRIARLALVLAIGGCLLINTGWLVYAAQTIADHHSDKFIRAVTRHISAERGTRFYVSPRLQIQVRDVGHALPPNIVDDPAMADRVLLYASEGFEHWQDWPANNPWLTEQWFGPYEVNFNIYPNWWGDDRIIELTEARARKLGILLTRTAASTREQ